MTTPDAADLARRRRWRRLVPVAAALLALGVCEVGLRRSDVDFAFYVVDAHRGWALRPGAFGFVIGERVMWLNINSDGLRDREHDRVKPPGTVRIAVLGDSYMEAANVPMKQMFTSQLEARLAGCRPAAEVINFGVTAYGITQEWLTYRLHATKYQPAIVVLAIYTANDMFDTLAFPGTPADTGLPYPVAPIEQRKPEPEIEATLLPWYQHLRLAITDRVETMKLLYGGWGALRAAWHPPPPRYDDPEDVLRDRAIYQPPASATMREAWRATEERVLALASEVAANGSEFWIVTLSNAEQVDPDLSARRVVATQLGVPDLLYPDRRIRDLATQHGIPVITLVEPLADYTATTGAYLNGGYNSAFPAGTGHWNDTAHRLAAGLVGDRLCASSPALARLR